MAEVFHCRGLLPEGFETGETPEMHFHPAGLLRPGHTHGCAIDPIAEQNISRRNRNSTPCLSATDVTDFEEIALQVIEI
jgi:hypothetical protein